MYLAQPRSATIYLTTECRILPLAGLNASVYTGLNAGRKMCECKKSDKYEVWITIEWFKTPKAIYGLMGWDGSPGGQG